MSRSKSILKGVFVTEQFFSGGRRRANGSPPPPDFPVKFFKFVWCVWATRLKGGSPTQVFGCGEFQRERLRFFGFKGFVGLNFVCKLRVQGG